MTPSGNKKSEKSNKGELKNSSKGKGIQNY
jgi:hypothetical protein